MDYEHIKCELDGRFMIVTLNRPEKLNAYTGQMGAEITDAFARADRDDAVRAVIVTGAGRAFCAGADVSGGAKSFDTSGSHGAGVFSSAGTRGGRFVEAIFNCRKPSIASVRAGLPPAMWPWIVSAVVPNVGGHSEASRTASRPLVPAPNEWSRPPSRTTAAISSTHREIFGMTRLTASTARVSASAMSARIS